ncbi:MAG: SDR family oxidoreductase [Caulobacteraceae bacterium]
MTPPLRKDFPAGLVVVVTGASAGVGRAVATRFARAGAAVGLIARDAEALERMKRELAAHGGRVSFRAVDVADAAAVFAAAADIESELGPIYLWVNDAMVTVFSPVSKITPEEFRRVTEVTYLGQVHGSMAALRHMRRRGRGHIVNIGSALAYRGIPLQGAYCGAKSAVRGFTAALRTELEHEKSPIKVSILELPAMNTPQFSWGRTHMGRQPKPMGAIYQPEVAAEAVFRAARRRPSEYWVGLDTIWTIVGNMVAPDILDRVLARTAVARQQTEVAVGASRKDNLFAPVGPLHATRGHFGYTAKARALIVDGQAMRAAVVVAGAAAFFVLGAAVAGAAGLANGRRKR